MFYIQVYDNLQRLSKDGNDLLSIQCQFNSQFNVSLDLIRNCNKFKAIKAEIYNMLYELPG